VCDIGETSYSPLSHAAIRHVFDASEAKADQMCPLAILIKNPRNRFSREIRPIPTRPAAPFHTRLVGYPFPAARSGSPTWPHRSPGSHASLPTYRGRFRGFPGIRWGVLEASEANARKSSNDAGFRVWKSLHNRILIGNWSSFTRLHRSIPYQCLG